MAIQDYSLKTVDFNPGIFTGAVYNPLPLDGKGMAEAIETQTTRTNTAIDTYNKIISTINALEPQLDESEYAWLRNKANDINNKIDTQIKLGYTGTALNTARTEATNFLNSPELKYKIEAKAARDKYYKENVLTVTKDPITLKRWQAENKYYDDNTGIWTPTTNVYKPKTIESLLQEAVAMTSPDYIYNYKQDIENIYLDENGNRTNNIDEAKSQTYAAGGTYEKHGQRKTTKKLIETFNKLLNNPDNRMALYQQFLDTIFAYENSTNDNEKEQYRKLLDNGNNGVLTKNNFEEWLDLKVKSVLPQMAYDNIQERDTRNERLTSARQGKQIQDLTTVTESVTTSGPSIRVGVESLSNQNSESYEHLFKK